MDREKKAQVFIISQIGGPETTNREWANTVGNYIITPIAGEKGLRVLRSDQDPTPGPITPQILRSILESKLVVADLTGRNANVFYELCFAHSFGIPVVSLVDDTESLPFDMKDERAIELKNENGRIDVSEAEKAKNKLREAFEVVLQDEYEPSSIVKDVAGIQSIENLSPENPVASELAALNRKVEQIQESIQSIGSEDSAKEKEAKSQYREGDVKTLIALVEKLGVQDRAPTAEDLKALENERTSPALRKWISAKADYIDIPF